MTTISEYRMNISSTVLKLETDIWSMIKKIDEELTEREQNKEYWMSYYIDWGWYLDSWSLWVYDSFEKAYEWFENTAKIIVNEYNKDNPDKNIDMKSFQNILDYTDNRYSWFYIRQDWHDYCSVTYDYESCRIQRVDLNPKH